jgi:phycocyanobilin:ferredoxin oxidoreductase
VSEIWNRLIDVENHYINRFHETGRAILNDENISAPGWTSRSWSSNTYRLANIVTADVRETKGMWMMHCCVFPHMENTAPIFGFDVVAGKNKITGCFHDFSSTGFASHPLIEWFGHEVSQLEWRKTRELPEWAQRIFSPHIIAAANVNEGAELEQIISMSTRNLDHYIDTVGETDGDCTDNTKGQNYYCENQKLNPHNPRVMTNLGLSEEQIRFFIEQCMFPET